MMSFSLPWQQIVFCLIAGLILSVIYLGLLWLTIRHLAKSTHQGLLLFLSAVLRIALFLTGAILLSQHNPARFLWIVVGFIMTRILLVGFIKKKETK